MKTSLYNAKALVNKGNCFFINSEFKISKETYLEAIGIQVDCVQEICNLGLESVRIDLPREASKYFDKLFTVLLNYFLIYHISNLYDQHNELNMSTKWFNVIDNRLPIEPGIFSQMEKIFSKQDDYS